PGSRIADREPVLAVRNALDPELDALTYEFRVSTDPAFETVLVSASGVPAGLSFTSWRVPVTLAENVVHHWSVRAWDGGSHSPWSSPVWFLVDTTDEPPSAPTPLRPLGDAHVRSLAPELVVANAADPEGAALTYRFEIDRSPAFDSPVRLISPGVPEGPSETSWTPGAPLEEDTRYYWRAAASDGHALGPWAGASFFVSVDNGAPRATQPLEPADLQIVTTAQPVLRVRNASDPEDDTLTYEFELRDADGMLVAAVAGVAAGALDTAWAVPSPLTENGLFSWRARAHDGQTAGPWTDTWRFRVNAVRDPPTSPSPLQPAEGAVLEEPRVVLVVANAVSPDQLLLAYAFELYREAEEGGSALVESVRDVAEGAGTTAWEPSAELADGRYAWRSRADDGEQPGPWTPSTHFSVRVDLPPAAPAGLTAVPGDGEVTLTWTASEEADVTGYRVYRAEVSGGPYAPVAGVAQPRFRDTGRANGITVFYVVTATDARFESRPSAEVAATPRPGVLAAQVSLSPDALAGECLVPAADSRWGCAAWIYATIELPPAHDPSAIARASVRLAGSVPPDPRYDRLVDRDRDGVMERELRFLLAGVRTHLRIGINELSVTGWSAGSEFAGVAPLVVADLVVDLRVTPRTLNRRSKGEYVQAELTFRAGVAAACVATEGVRLNGTLKPVRVVKAHGERLTLKFDRDAVARRLPLGEAVPIWITGTIGGVPFQARDVVRVIP
ncbi:MAG TPA: hypothetical protein VIG50_10340, partial [Vicinamibacteria bacterium]